MAIRKTKRVAKVLSWVPIEKDYSNREGYQANFLKTPVPVPALTSAGPLRSRDLTDLIPYEHFSLRMHKKRKLAVFTAVNIHGGRAYRMKDRSKDTWHEDTRVSGYQTMQSFYQKPFHRGHLVRRLDPAWGKPAQGQRAEADTFHWTNCSPQHGTLNTKWWLGVESHVLDTANTTRQQVTVFAGPVFTSKDPLLRGCRVPLAYWKVVAWVAPGAGGGLRSLGFLVRQDELVAALVTKKARPLSVDFDNTPKKVQAYQATVEEISRATGLNFGRLSSPKVDVYARVRDKRPGALMLAPVDAYRRLGKLNDLIVG